MIETICGRCSNVLRSGDAARGKAMACPQCKAPLVIGGAPAPVTPAAAVTGVVDFRTQNRGREIVVRAEARVAFSATAYLERVRTMPPIEHGTPLLLGPFSLVAVERNGRLVLCEQDLSRPTAIRTDDLTSIFALLAYTTRILQEIGVRAENFELTDAMVFRAGPLGWPEITVEHWSEPTPGDCGWFAGPPGKGFDEIRHLPDPRAVCRDGHVWELYAVEPLAVTLLALPRGFRATVSAGKHIEVRDPDRRVVWRE